MCSVVGGGYMAHKYRERTGRRRRRGKKLGWSDKRKEKNN